MEDAVRFDTVIAEELPGELTFEVASGSFAAAVTGRQEESSLQMRLMLGLARPLSGRVTLLGEDLGDASEKKLNALRRQVGVVYPAGGLVSNLKVWENLVLPLEYFSLYPAKEIEERGMAALERVGYSGGLMELPGHLSLYGRKQVGLARVLLLEPRLAVYDELLTGLSGEQRSNMIRIVEAFHRESPGRTSLFLTANDEAVRGLAVEDRIAIKGSSSNGQG